MNAAHHAYGGYERIGHEKRATNRRAPGKPTHGDNRCRKHMAARKRLARRVFLYQGINGKQLIRTRRIEALAKHAQANKACSGNANARNKQLAMRKKKRRQQNRVGKIERGGQNLVRRQQHPHQRGTDAKRGGNLFVLQCVHPRPPCFRIRVIVA